MSTDADKHENSPGSREFRTDAELFIAKLDQVERLISSVAQGGPFTEEAIRGLATKLDSPELLRFIAWSTNASEEGLSSRIKEAGLPDDTLDQIVPFARKYRYIKDPLYRAFRSEAGYENEFTRLGARPMIYTKSGEVVVEFEVYSHDRQLLTSRQALKGLVRFTEMLLDTVCDVIEDVDRTFPAAKAAQVAARVMPDLLKQVDRLRAIIAGGAQRPDRILTAVAPIDKEPLPGRDAGPEPGRSNPQEDGHTRSHPEHGS